jgi:hypothetical protein
MSDSEKGRVQWANVQVEWTGGEKFVVRIPHFIDPWPVQWLDDGGGLASHLRGVEEFRAVYVSVSQATRAREGSGWDAPGRITLTNVAPPWPSGFEVREAVEAAVAEAYVEAKAAEDEARALLSELRVTT